MKTLFALLVGATLVALGAAETKMCTCDVQTKCFERAKQETTECFNTCQKSADLTSVTKDPSRLDKCFKMKDDSVTKLFDCLNSQCKESNSCANSGEEKKVSDDHKTGTLFADQMQPLVERIHEFMRTLNKDNNPFVEVFADLQDCRRKCSFDKMRENTCFNEQKCELEINNEKIKPLMEHCFRNMDFKNVAKDVCECFSENGVENISTFCTQLQSAERPKDVLWSKE
jgi:hypothetical protein